MGRLTARTAGKGLAYLAKVKPDEQEVESKYPATLQCILDSWERLAAYEDTGLMPEDIILLKQELDMIKAERDRAVAHLTRLCQYIEPVECGGGGFYCHQWDKACDNCRYAWERKEEE